MYINEGKIPQIFSIGSIYPLVIYPGMVVNEKIYKSVRKETDRFREFNFNEFKNKECVTLFRSFALGDIIQLVVAARYFKNYYNIKNINILSRLSYVKILNKLFTDIHFASDSSIIHKDYGLSFHLDAVLERDHKPENIEHGKHRVEIFLNTLGITEIDKSQLNWNGFTTNYKFEESNMKFIGLQIRGSTDIKTLPLNTIKNIAKELSSKYKVVLLHDDKSYGFEGENIINLCGKVNTFECIAVLTKLDCCITMDSGMLWMAHVAKCPILTILGATREHERISLHPLYPEKAKCINISEEIIGCEPCFETKIFCKGKMNCMRNFDENKLINLIKERILKILGE